MKFLFALMLNLLLSAWAHPQTSVELLPAAVTALLNQKYPGAPAEHFPGWKLAEINARESQWLKNNGLNAAHPAFITGNFDGNGSADYAILLWYGTAETRQRVSPNVFVVALLGQKGGYKLLELNPGGCDECYRFLTVGRKGKSRYEAQTGKRFVYQRDTPEAWVVANAGRAFTNLVNETYGGKDITRVPAKKTP